MSRWSLRPISRKAITCLRRRSSAAAVPKNFHPAVDKGIREAMEHGVLAGYPLVGLHATLLDGSYHDVDSNELSFKMAARLAYKAGIPQASPVLLEPVCSLRVVVPDSYMGDVIGDLNKRRGRIMGMNPDRGRPSRSVVAEVSAWQRLVRLCDRRCAP